MHMYKSQYNSHVINLHIYLHVYNIYTYTYINTYLINQSTICLGPSRVRGPGPNWVRGPGPNQSHECRVGFKPGLPGVRVSEGGAARSVGQNIYEYIDILKYNSDLIPILFL